jgi:hypothetical protein
MFTPSREKVEAAQRYLDEVRSRVRGWKNTRGKGGGRQRTGKPLWRQIPHKWHGEANAQLARLIAKYWREHGHGPSQQKHASLIGNVVWTIRNCRMSNHYHSRIWKFWNARMVVDASKHIRNPQDRRGFTPRTAKARSSQGSLAGI